MSKFNPGARYLRQTRVPYQSDFESSGTAIEEISPGVSVGAGAGRSVEGTPQFTRLWSPSMFGKTRDYDNWIGID